MYNEECHYEWQDHIEVFKLHLKIGNGNIYFKLKGTKCRSEKYDPDEEHDGYLRRGEKGNLEFILWGSL
jgi:DNA relaxase NicK